MSSRTRIAAIVTASALSLSLAGQAAHAAGPSPAPAPTADAVAAKALQQSGTMSVREIRTALAKAKRAKKRAQQRVAARAAELESAQNAAAGPAATYQAVSARVETSRTAHTQAQKALERVRLLIANEQSIWDSLRARRTAAYEAYLPFRQAYEAEVAKLSPLRAQQSDLFAQHRAVVDQLNAANAAASDLSNNQIPVVSAQLQNAWNNETNLWNQKEAALAAFQNKKAQYADCRKNFGKWECRDQGSTVWKFVPRLDELEAALEDLRARYNIAKNIRQDLEGQLAYLNARLNAIYADIAQLQNTIATINGQISANSAEIDRVSAAANAARDLADAKYAAVRAIDAEADALEVEIAAAKKDEPALAATEKSLAQELAATTTALAAATSAHQAAQSVVATAVASLSDARAVLAKAKQRVKKLTRKLRRALRGR